MGPGSPVPGTPRELGLGGIEEVAGIPVPRETTAEIV